MARAKKRANLVSLTKTKRRSTLDHKNKLIENVRASVDKYEYVYLLSLNNQRNSHLKDVRVHFDPSRVFCTKNKVLKLALGATPQTEVADNVHQIAIGLQGERCLLFTDEKPQSVLEFFHSFHPDEFARAGAVATDTLVFKEGSDVLHRFQSSMEPHFRKLSLPTTLKNGKIEILGDKVICEAGKPLSVEAVQILKHLDIKMCQFDARVLSVWDKSDSSVKQLEAEVVQAQA
eukprot:Selendium_serpulae@DN6877_c0_g1_i1.p1